MPRGPRWIVSIYPRRHEADLTRFIPRILADYQRGGSLLRHVEEEMLVIAIFGLFWLSMLLRLL